MTATAPTAVLVPIQPAFSNAERLALADFVLAENLVRAAQAACSYSLRIPPRRWRRRTFRRAICPGSMIGGGSGHSGRALAMPW